MGTSMEGVQDDVASDKLQQRQSLNAGVNASQSVQEVTDPIIPEKASEAELNPFFLLLQVHKLIWVLQGKVRQMMLLLINCCRDKFLIQGSMHHNLIKKQSCPPSYLRRHQKMDTTGESVGKSMLKEMSLFVAITDDKR